MRGERIKYHYKQAIISPPAKRFKMAFRWRADDGPALNAGLPALWLFSVSRPVLLRNSIFLVIFQGVRTLYPPPPQPLWISAWEFYISTFPFYFSSDIVEEKSSLLFLYSCFHVWLLRNSIFLVIFQGVRTLYPPPPQPLWISAWEFYISTFPFYFSSDIVEEKSSLLFLYSCFHVWLFVCLYSNVSSTHWNGLVWSLIVSFPDHTHLVFIQGKQLPLEINT